MIYWVNVEGPDNIGKTSLIEDISWHYQLNENVHEIIYRHFGAPTSNDPYSEQKELTYNILKHIKCQVKRFKDKNLLILHDRSIFGELAYSKFRNYKPNYFYDIVKKLNNINNLRTLVIILYADKNTYKRFNIEPKKETCNYESPNETQQISVDFINELHKYNLKILTINSNNYDSLDARNDIILKYIDKFVSNKPMKFETVFKTVNNYSMTPFNPDNMILGEKDWICSYHCESYKNKTCPLGIQHETSIFGMKYKQPTYAVGTTISKNLKYIFIGEAPRRNGCGKLGIPFYDDRSGNLFNEVLYDLNINMFNCYISNVIKCCPTNNNLGIYNSLENRMTLECVQNLKYELINLDYNRGFTKLIAIGRVAFDTLLNLGFGPILLYHPAYYLSMGEPDIFIQDFKKILKK